MNFWYNAPSALSKLLKPLSMVYPTLSKLREVFTVPYRAKTKVVCVGNVVVGGSGKTPTVIALAKQFQEQGLKVNILSRGYGGSLEGPILVDPEIHKASDVGDEPLLLCHAAPTLVSKSRLVGVKYLEQHADVDVILLDDGLQNPSVYKDYVYLVISASQGIGNGLCLPFGPLREPLGCALKKADEVFVLGQGDFKIDGAKYINFNFSNADDFKDQDVVAFAGIGYPQKFFNSLTECGATLVHTRVFPDHHPYQQSDFDELLKYNMPLVTTAKDYVRLPESIKSNVHVLQLSIDHIPSNRL